jgi:hypothetical protein
MAWYASIGSNDKMHEIIRGEIQKRQLHSLTESSHNIEHLTERLIQLTKWLIGLTIVLAVLTLLLVLDIGNKFRQEYFSPLPPPTAPQTPTRPPG